MVTNDKFESTCFCTYVTQGYPEVRLHFYEHFHCFCFFFLFVLAYLVNSVTKIRRFLGCCAVQYGGWKPTYGKATMQLIHLLDYALKTLKMEATGPPKRWFPHTQHCTEQLPRKRRIVSYRHGNHTSHRLYNTLPAA
jgi:hypothetical protein